VNDRATQIEEATRHRRAQRVWGRQAAPGRGYVITVTLLAGAFMLAAGIWSLSAPRSFAEAVQFPYAEHFLHDLGAFQIGIGVTLLLAAAWSDALALALAGFLVANSIHAVNHAVDLDLGGRGSDPWLLGALSLLIAAALVVRLRELGYVVGVVGTAAAPPLEPFVRQKTALLTTYRRDGTPVGTPLSVAVEGDHAFIRSYEQAWKAKRMRNRPEVELAPSTARGKPTGPAIHARARLLEGTEARHAGHALASKHPLLHGVLVPLAHRLGRSKTGRTVHYELVPLDD
jgi:PPOX class probable F420-dependent enzyme